MNQSVQNYPGLAGSGALAAERNRVLRNTYWLLALSMVPTMLDAWIGVQTSAMRALTNGVSLMVFLVDAFGFMFAIEKFKNSPIGVGLLLAFTFFMGLMLSRLLGFVLGMSNGASLVMLAFGGTAAVFGVMATIAQTSKRDFSSMGRWLTIGFVVLFVGIVANIWLQIPALMLALSAMAIVIFSLFILYDLKRVVDGGETNYVTATLSIYISVYNVFSNLLAILGVTSGDD